MEYKGHVCRVVPSSNERGKWVVLSTLESTQTHYRGVVNTAGEWIFHLARDGEAMMFATAQEAEEYISGHPRKKHKRLHVPMF